MTFARLFPAPRSSASGSDLRPAGAGRGSRLVIALLFAAVLPAAGFAQPIPGQNINMVSGTSFPGGDPFLQRQNEPSIAMSSVNPLHLLAGANDYRTVDLPALDALPGSLAGDAWLSYFVSLDGGLSWRSTLLPGFPQDQSAEGLASPLKGFAAAADPTVRAGTDGLFYYSGIVFNRGSNEGSIFVARLLDTNRKENGDAAQGQSAIQYLDAVAVDTGTSGQFLDKTWIGVDVPRAGAGTCTLPTLPPRTIPAGNVYLVWSRFTGSTSTKIMFSRSLDCGRSWSNPIKLSESNSINQGTNVAIEPLSGTIYVTWRRFASSSQPSAILVARSTDFGKTFPSKNTVEVATIDPFDQGTSPTRFRTNTLPTIAASVDSTGVSRVHVAWAQRNSSTGDSQIVLSTSSDGSKWSNPAAVDASPIADDFSNAFSLGHQFMPQLTFAAGRLMLLYYDQRLDHTLGFHIPNNPFQADAEGRFYLVRREKKGELLTDPQQVFTLQLDDALLTMRRHTIDLRVAEAIPGPALQFEAATVSSYRLGLRSLDDSGNPIASPEGLDQLESNPPNLPLFGQGTLPFIGDYIDIAGETFKANGDGTWSFNTSLSSPPVFYAAWTDNRDVRPPVDGDWTHYTPVGGGGPSVLDPTQTTPPCLTGQEGMRNQNIYGSRITEGLLVSSPQNVKPLSPTFQRAFVVTLQNFTPQDRTFAMALDPQTGVQASFLQGSGLLSLEVTVPARSGAARPVFASSSNPAGRITVNVAEVPGPGSLGLSGAIVLNPEGSVSPLEQPDGTTMDIGTLEVYTPSFAVWNPANPNPFLNISNPNQVLNISNLNISNADPAILNISNLNISNLNISNLNISNPDPANLNISNLNISNTTAANLNISNLNISNLNISNTALSDTTYAVTNSGNTTHSYRVALYGNNPFAAPLQLIVTKSSSMPTSVNCTLQNQPQGVVVANVNDAVVAPTLAAAADPNIPDSSASNATMSLAPGETVFLTLRGALTPEQMAQLVRQLTPVVTAHGANTNGVTPDFALLLFIQTGNGSELPAAVVASPYSATLEATGGKPPLSWNLVSGSLPAGLTLSSAGVISGVPSESGAFTFTVQVTDSTSPVPQTATQALTLTVDGRATAAVPLAISPNPVVVDQAASVTFTVADAEPTGEASSPTGTVTVSGGAGVVGGTCALAPTGAPAESSCTVPVTASAAGSYTITASEPGSSVHQPASATGTLQVLTRATATAVSVSPDPLDPGEAGAVLVTVTDVETAGAKSSPAGTVSLSSSTPGDAFGPAPTCTLAPSGPASSSCSATLTAASGGDRTISAAYPGSPAHGPSGSSTPLTVRASTTTTVTSDAPDPSFVGQAVSVAFAVARVPPVSGIPTGSVTVAVNDGSGASCTGALSGGSGGCSLTLLVAGGWTLTATYSGSPADTPSSGAAAHQVDPAPPFYAFTGFLSPLAAAGTLASPSDSGTANFTQGVPIKWQLKDSSGNFVKSLSSTLSLSAVFYADGGCAGQATGPTSLLYSPTSGAAGGSTFRYDQKNNQFLFNWSTSQLLTGPGCYELVLQLDDGSPAKATRIRLQ